MSQMEYTAQNLEYAVSVFYNGEQAERAKAHTWLTAAQRVPEAWNFVWELLQPTKGTEIQFYAATTLHTKILRCWNEVPPDSYNELKEKILQAVIAYSKGPKIVTNRLCISLAAFILQQGAVDLASILRPLSTAENTSQLLEVLIVIPEEYNSMTMGTVLRSKNKAALQQASTMVLDDMLRYLQTAYNDYSTEGPSDEAIQCWLTAATCAGSWLTLGGEDSLEIGATTLPERAPLCRALQTVVHVLYTCNEAVSDIALEACEACLAAVRAAGTAGGAARHPAAALQLLAQLAALAAPLLAAHNVPDSINEELLSAVITCCVAVAECHSRALVQAVERGDEGATRLLDLMLAAQAAPGHYPVHETRSNLVFGLWYTLQDEVLNMHTSDVAQKVNPIWREVFSRLLMILITKSEAPSDLSMSRDDLELLRCYRQDIADTVMYCYSVLGDWCWSSVEAAFTSADSDVRREAVLHTFLALGDAAPNQSAPPALLLLLQHALRLAHSATHRRALHTALDCLGSYAMWLSSVQGPRGAELSRECLRAAGSALPRCAAPAALALRRLAAECSAPAAELAADIVQAAQSPEGRADAWVRRQLLGAAGAALAAAAPAAAAPLLQDLAHTLRLELHQQAEKAPSAASGASGASAAASCAALVAALTSRPALAADLFRYLLPALRVLPAHAELTEPMFQILKHTVSALMEDCLPLVNDIAQLTIAGFHTQPCPVGLDVVKLVVVLVGDEWNEAGRLLHACVCASARLVAPDPTARPDLTDGLFTLLLNLTKKKSGVYIDWIDDLLPELVDLACSCVRVWEACGGRAACGWLAALAGRRPALLRPRAPALAAAALHAIGGGTPRNQLEPLADLLLALNRAWAAELGDWLRHPLALPGFPTPHASHAHKDAFVAAVLKEKNSKRRLLETVQEFSLVCRGLIGTEYARQTLASKQLVA